MAYIVGAAAIVAVIAFVLSRRPKRPSSQVGGGAPSNPRKTDKH